MAYTEFGYGDEITWGGRLPFGEEEEEAFDEAVTTKADELMEDGEDCSPTNLMNIMEALSETTNETMKKIEAELQAKNPAVFDLIENVSFDYWAKLARNKAEHLMTDDQ